MLWCSDTGLCKKDCMRSPDHLTRQRANTLLTCRVHSIQVDVRTCCGSQSWCLVPCPSCQSVPWPQTHTRPSSSMAPETHRRHTHAVTAGPMLCGQIGAPICCRSANGWVLDTEGVNLMGVRVAHSAHCPTNRSPSNHTARACCFEDHPCTADVPPAHHM
jgi:hypothetical protein